MVRPPRRATSQRRPDFRPEASRRQIPLPDRNNGGLLPRDVLDFLFEYPFADPAEEEDPRADLNARFFEDRQAAKPRRAKCTELQDELRDNWDDLEDRHDFVQWLFPIREQGLNWDAQPLRPHEIARIKSNPEAMARLLESYRIMLAFYGLRIVDPTTGELELNDASPAPSSGSYLKRFRNLERNMHNYLRITRILKCLGEFGLDQHPPSFLLYLLALQAPASSETLDGPYLDTPSLTRSYDNYWRWCVRNDHDRQFIVMKSDQVREEEADWTVEEYREWVRRRAEERSRTVSSGGEADGDGGGGDAQNMVDGTDAGELTAIAKAEAEEADTSASAVDISTETKTTVASSVDLPSPFKKPAPDCVAPSEPEPGTAATTLPVPVPDTQADEVDADDHHQQAAEPDSQQSSLTGEPPRKTFAQLELEADETPPESQSQSQIQSDVEGPPPLARLTNGTNDSANVEASEPNDAGGGGGGGLPEGQDSLPSPFKKARISDENDVEIGPSQGANHVSA